MYALILSGCSYKMRALRLAIFKYYTTIAILKQGPEKLVVPQIFG